MECAFRRENQDRPCAGLLDIVVPSHGPAPDFTAVIQDVPRLFGRMAHIWFGYNDKDRVALTRSSSS